jgi:hypothetical protein
VSTEDATTLLQLRALWHDRYVVDVARDGTWSARRQDAAERLIIAESGQLLRHKISEDFALWQASLEPARGAGVVLAV